MAAGKLKMKMQRKIEKGEGKKEKIAILTGITRLKNASF